MYNKELDKLVVSCQGNSWISIDKVGYPGRPPMMARDFHNGFLSKHNEKKKYFLC